MLHFDTNGEFRILIIADIQDGNPLDEIKQKKLEQLINVANPGLIVLLGDMIFGPVVFSEKKARAIIESILKPIEKKQIPFAFVTGNHDTDSRVTTDKQMEMYRRSSLCITPMPSDRKCRESYSLFVQDDNKLAVQLVFHDSGRTHITLRGVLYDPVSYEQLRYETEALQENKDIPAFVFQHIPVPEIYKLISVTEKETQGSIRTGSFLNRKYMKLKNPQDGTLGEHPCPPDRNAGQFNNLVQSGNVKAAVFGHDHKNSFCGEVEGIKLIQTACAGLSCYGDDRLRGGRVVKIQSDGKFSTEEIKYAENYVCKYEKNG